MSEQSTSSRRALLGAAAAGAVGLTAASLRVPAPAAAASGDDFVLGEDNDAGEDETTITSSNPFHTFKATGSGAYAISGEGTGAESTGVIGIGSGPGIGVRGHSPSGISVRAVSVADGRFRIRLNKPVPGLTKVAFFVFEQVVPPED